MVNNYVFKPELHEKYGRFYIPIVAIDPFKNLAAQIASVFNISTSGAIELNLVYGDENTKDIIMLCDFQEVFESPLDTKLGKALYKK